MLDRILDICEQASDRIFFQTKNQTLTYHQLKERILPLIPRLQNMDGVIVLKGHKEVDLVVMMYACLVAHKCYFIMENDIPEHRSQLMLSKFKVGCLVDCSENPTGMTVRELLNMSYSNEKYLDELAYIAFTSGTSGEPKGIQITRNNLNHFIDWCLNISPLKSLHHQRIMNFVSFSFDLSLADIIFGFFSFSTVIADEMNYLTQGSIHDIKPTMLVLTPTMAKVLMLDHHFDEQHLPELEMIFFAGEILEKKTYIKLRNRFSTCKIINAYGPTEATCVVTGIEIKDEHLQYESLPIGDMTTHAVDITLNEENEIILAGKSVFLGYIGEKVARTCYATGDLGFIQDNLLFFKQRKGRQIKWKGYRIEPDEIEKCILRLEEVESARIESIYDGEIIKAFDAHVSVNMDIDEKQIKSFIRQYLPEYMIPRRIRIQKEILMNERGKKA